uniref:Family with sequence similarity 13 member A n=2 Tax=Callorhinchus milii TaxID=7868 RepID=A0A4W3I5Q4_CALMI|eukprot:gi/632968790/ref/XP_007900721.1/ PREDICTED: protein FAM13A [Callorhinchus milii]
MGAGAITVCQNKAAVRLKEDVKSIMAQPFNVQRSFSVRKVFGMSLRDLQQQGQAAEDGIPRVVLNMVAYLNEYGLQQEGIFRVNGNVKAVERLRLKYDKGEKLDLAEEGDICSVASLLKLFLRELPDAVIPSKLHLRFMQFQYDHNGNLEELKYLIKQLPDINYCLLKFLCHFLTQVAIHHEANRMTVYNLGTVFGPNVFRVSPGFEGMKEQNISNKLMASMLENYDFFFENVKDADSPPANQTKLIVVQEATSELLFPVRPCPVPHSALNTDTPRPLPRRKKSKKAQTEGGGSSSSSSSGVGTFLTLQPEWSAGSPEATQRLPAHTASRQEMESSEELAHRATEQEINSSAQEDDRPMSPFYLSAHVSPVNTISSAGDFMEQTIRSVVEQHLFDVHGNGVQSSEESEAGTSLSAAVTARQRRRHLKEQDEARRSREMDDINKENIPSVFGANEEGKQGLLEPSQPSDKKLKDSGTSYIEEGMKPKKQKSSSKLSELNENQDSSLVMENSSFATSWSQDPFAGAPGGDLTFLVQPDDVSEQDRKESATMLCEKDTYNPVKLTLNSAMKIQESQSQNDAAKAGRSGDPAPPEGSTAGDVPRLDLTGLSEHNDWGEPVPAFSSWQRPEAESEEARLSPQAGRLIRHLLEEDTHPMVSPRFYAYGQSQQFQNDTEVPPSPPNSHSFMRRRSSSLGSYDDDREDLTPAQMSKRIQNLKKKIRKFEEKFEEERRYRPSHSDKATNPEVLKWMNELAKLRKQLKDVKLNVSEEDLAPQVRQRSNTLPKSFGSQLEKGPEQEKKPDVAERAQKPTVDTTLESILKKLQEKRVEMQRSEDIKDMTRDQISEEKVALQKGLLYYESIHGRPVTKSERLVMKPLYDRYRLVKQILSRATTIPVIEEEDGSEEDCNAKPDFTVPVKPVLTIRSFLDQLDDEAEGFVSPVDEKAAGKCTLDLRLSNLHSASMPELLEQLQEARTDKKRLRKTLRDFEDTFFQENGRNVQKEDRAPMTEEYNEYKHVKAKLRLLEVLISKQDSSKVV